MNTKALNRISEPDGTIKPHKYQDEVDRQRRADAVEADLEQIIAETGGWPNPAYMAAIGRKGGMKKNPKKGFGTTKGKDKK